MGVSQDVEARDLNAWRVSIPGERILKVKPHGVYSENSFRDLGEYRYRTYHTVPNHRRYLGTELKWDWLGSH